MKLTLNPAPKKKFMNLGAITTGESHESKSKSKSTCEGSSTSESKSCSESPSKKEEVIETGFTPEQLLNLILTPEERDHAVFGGSSASIWSNCTAHIPTMRKLYEQGFKQEQTEHTINGTQAHMCAELITKSELHNLVTGEVEFGLNVRQAFRMFISHSSNETEKVLREDMVKQAHYYAEHIFKEALEGFITGKEWGFERKLTISKELDMSGFVDFWAIYTNDKGQRVGVIVDFKYGRVEVDVKNNSQLLFYGIGLKKEEALASRDIDAVHVYIFQPKSSTSWKSHKFTKKQLETGEKKFIKAARTVVIEKKAIAKVGEHCRWPKCKTICPKYIGSLQATSGIAFLTPDVMTFPEVPTLSIDQAALIYSTKDMFDALFDNLGAILFKHARLGNTIEGYKLIKARKNSTFIKDLEKVEAALEALNDKFELDIKYKEPKLLALGKIKEQIEKIKNNDLLPEDAEKLFNSIWHRPEGELVLVPESHKGEAVEVKSLLTPMEELPPAYMKDIKVLKETGVTLIEDDLI